MVNDSNLLYFYTFNDTDLQNGYYKNQITNNYDLLTSASFSLNGTLKIGSRIMNSSISLGSFVSIGVWFKSTNNFGMPYFLNDADRLGEDISIYLNNNTMYLRSIGSKGNVFIQTITNNTWYNVVYVNDNGNWYIYVNGYIVKTYLNYGKGRNLGEEIFYL